MEKALITTTRPFQIGEVNYIYQTKLLQKLEKPFSFLVLRLGKALSK